MSRLGEIVLKSQPLRNVNRSVNNAGPGVEMKVNKAAVEPVWYLPGVAERFGMSVLSFFTLVLSSLTGGRSESLLRRTLFEDTGGMYPELITRPDIKVFLPQWVVSRFTSVSPLVQNIFIPI